MAQKKISAALMPMNCESWSIQTTLSSVSAANVRCWAYPDRRITTGRHRCGHRRCASWPGSMLSTWRIPTAVFAGWWSTWPGKASRSAAIVCETLCAAWGYELSTRNPAPPCQASHPSALPVWWTSCRSGPLTSLGDRYHLHPAAGRILLPGGDRGSVLQKRAQLEAHGQP